MANVGKILSRGVGAAAIYFIAKDAHVNGKVQADIDVKTKGAKAAAYFMENTMYMDRPSITKSRMKNWVFRKELGQNIRGFINSFTGYVKGFVRTLGQTVLPLGLGLMALLAKGNTLTKGSAIGLLAIGLFSFVKDGLGIGKPKGLTTPIE